MSPNKNLTEISPRNFFIHCCKKQILFLVPYFNVWSAFNSAMKPDLKLGHVRTVVAVSFCPQSIDFVRRLRTVWSQKTTTAWGKDDHCSNLCLCWPGCVQVSTCAYVLRTTPAAPLRWRRLWLFRVRETSWKPWRRTASSFWLPSARDTADLMVGSTLLFYLMW